MSTAVDTAFEELMSAQGAEPEPLHYVCATCYPIPVPGVVAVCGYVCRNDAPPDPEGAHKCAPCLRLYEAPAFPCGH